MLYKAVKSFSSISLNHDLLKVVQIFCFCFVMKLYTRSFDQTREDICFDVSCFWGQFGLISPILKSAVPIPIKSVLTRLIQMTHQKGRSLKLLMLQLERINYFYLFNLSSSHPELSSNSSLINRPGI